MRAPKARDARPGLMVRLFRVVWVVTLTSGALVGGVFWIGKSHCPEPCRIDGTHAQAAAQGTPSQGVERQVPQAAYSKPKAIR